MAELLADRPKVADLRGTPAAAQAAAVLEDPTGRRRRRLRLAGRLVAVVLTLWLVALVAGGVGLGPVPGIPLVGALRPAVPPLAPHLPRPARPTPSDLRPAAPARVAATQPAASSPSASAEPRAVARRTPAHAPAVTHNVAHPAPHAVVVPPTTTTTPAVTHPNNGKHTGSSTTGRSTAPAGTGTTTTTTTTTAPAHGKSGSAPGRLKNQVAVP